MKLAIFCLSIGMLYLPSHAQHAGNLKTIEGSIELDIEPGYEVKFIGDQFPFYKIIHCVITNKYSGKIAEEFFRYSDSCFAYIRYDSNQNQIEKGLICINPNRQHNDSILVPDLEKDPDLSKGIMKNFILSGNYFDKKGQWQEVESTLITRRGMYKEGKKTGIWKVGYYQKNPIHPNYTFLNEIFKVECTEKYVNGEYDSTYQPDYSFANIWDKLKGRWVFSTFNSLHRIQHVYIKQQPSESMHGIGITFIDSVYLFEGIDTKVKWKLQNGIIYKYCSKDDVQRFKIDYISELELYLTPLPPVSESKIRKKKK